MRKITKTHTGMIVSDTDLKLEYLYVGDYGKENNIKADFLGYTKRIDKVEHRDVAEAQFASAPIALNSNLLPVNAKGEVLLRSVLSISNSGI